MNPQQLLDEILSILRSVMDDKDKLEKIYQFLMDEIYEEAEETEIPEKYKSLVRETADSISAGLVCFINGDTLEIESLPKDALEDSDEFETMTGETLESLGLKHDEWKNCIEIEPIDSHESFKIMEGFADKVADNKLQQKLINALNHKRPFANFKHLIDNSNFRQDWFDYRQAWLEQYVYNILEYKLNKK